jgi:hypothetical protein
LASLLLRLANQPKEVEQMKLIARRVRLEHTWTKRAEQVANLLIGPNEAIDQ